MAFNGTGSNVTSLNAENISSGTLAVGRGGTGATTLNAAAVIIGNGTSAPTFVAPGTSGNLLTSNGSAWSSTAPAAPTIADGSVTDAKISDGLTASTTYYPIESDTLSGSVNNTSLNRVVSFRCLRGGTYNIRFRVLEQSGDTYTNGSRIYVNGVAVGSTISGVMGASTGRTDTHSNITISRNQVVDIYLSNSNGLGNIVALANIQVGSTGSIAIIPFTTGARSNTVTSALPI